MDPFVQTSAVPGRVFIGPEPASPSPHVGYRGAIRYSLVGVHLHAGKVAFGPSRPVLPTEKTDEYGWVWEVSEADQLIPWHQVHSISWGERWAL